MQVAGSLIDHERVNAAFAWILVGFLAFAAVESAIDGELLWAGLAAAGAAVALLPPIVTRDPWTMASWIVLFLVTVPLVARSLGVITEIATYLAVAALALLVAVEIEVFSSVEMTPPFAIAFVVITTMAIAGGWAIARFFSDQYLGTSFLAGHADLMWDLVLATAVGLAAGLLFEVYFRRFEAAGDRFEDGGEPL